MQKLDELLQTWITFDVTAENDVYNLIYIHIYNVNSWIHIIDNIPKPNMPINTHKHTLLVFKTTTYIHIYIYIYMKKNVQI